MSGSIQRRMMRAARLLLAAFVMAAAGTSADQAQPVDPGPDAMPELPDAELIEFFWYGCPQCDRMQGLLKSAGLRQQVYYIPAVIRGSWSTAARLFYALQAMGEIDRLHDAIFDDVHRKGKPVRDRADIEALIERHDLDRDRFLQLFDSPGIEAQVRRAVRWTRRYAAAGVPSFVIKRHHIANPERNGDLHGTLQAVQQLLENTE